MLFSYSYVPAAGLLREDGAPKEAFFRLEALEKSWGFSFGGKGEA
jgi:hypothetical protein